MQTEIATLHHDSLGASDSQATTANYYEIAKRDDEGVKTPPRGQHTKSDRTERMRAAVERSRLEYKTGHAYTEPLWFTLSHEGDGRRSKPKMNTHNLEYLVTSMYYSSPPEYAATLQIILSAFDSTAKALGNLSKEVVQTGMDCATRTGHAKAAVLLAESTESLWKSQPGIAMSAGRCYMSAGHPRDALRPLLASTALYGLSVPVLALICVAIDEISRETTLPPSTRALRLLVQNEIDKQTPSYARSIRFDDAGDTGQLSAEDFLPRASSDTAITTVFDDKMDEIADFLVLTAGDCRQRLKKTIYRLAKAGGDPVSDLEGRAERSVGQL